MPQVDFYILPSADPLARLAAVLHAPEPLAPEQLEQLLRRSFLKAGAQARAGLAVYGPPRD